MKKKYLYKGKGASTSGRKGKYFVHDYEIS